MNTNTGSYVRPMVEQVTNNATSWIGHRPGDNKEIVTGQTFIASSTGALAAIEVYSTMVTHPGKVVMTLYSFDPAQNNWGPALGSTSVDLIYSDNDKWISFNIPGLRLDKGKTYGFKLECPNSYIGVGEAAGSSKQPPFTAGQEWRFTNNNQKGDSFSYFSLAFKVGLRA
ncbi:MAG TPA: hypothetical protein VK498_10490 [Ferruginibacter sp.]|nr:hypothetical protein [Ferruginibacter sp.]